MNLFSPLALGDIQLSNRIVMAPLTRLRADEAGVPNELLVEHYAQRAGIGMIVTEGTWPVQESRSYPRQPGIETEAQVEGWRRVADAVHEEGGRIVLQLMHGGRVSHPEITGTPRIVAPSAIAAPGETRTAAGKVDLPVPHALTLDEVRATIDAFVRGAENAIRAGLDGVEVHGANGYLIHEFLSPVSNVRDDQYGGSPENRARFAIEVTAAVVDAIGAGRTGIRLSPEHNIQGVLEEDGADVLATYTALAKGLAPLNLAFVDVLHPEPAGDLVQTIRRLSGAPLITNTGFATPTSREEALALVADGHADAVGVGRAAIANPDLAIRWELETEENELVGATIYGPDHVGYTDYPALETVRSAR